MKPNYKKYELRKVARKNYTNNNSALLTDTDINETIDMLREIRNGFVEIGRADIFDMILGSWIRGF